MGRIEDRGGSVKRRTSKTLSPLGERALIYAASGAFVFPCYPGTKKPATPNGFKDGTLDQAQVRAWWREMPDANIAMWCRKSGVVVLDVDCKPGGADGPAALQRLELKYSSLGSFPRQATPSGGFHVFIEDPLVNLPGVLKGIGEIKCNGYVMLAPSKFTDEGYPSDTYAWAGESEGDFLEPPEMPEWLLAELAPRGPESLSAQPEPKGDELVRACLQLPRMGQSVASPRTPWLAVGMALHWASNGGTRGQEAWDAWSAQCPDRYQQKEQDKAWAHFRSDVAAPKTTGTLVHLAQACQDRWDEGDPVLVEMGLIPEGKQSPDPIDRSAAEPEVDAPADPPWERLTPEGDVARYVRHVEGRRMWVDGLGWLAYRDGFWNADGAETVVANELCEVCRDELKRLFELHPRKFLALVAVRKDETEDEAMRRGLGSALAMVDRIRYQRDVRSRAAEELTVPHEQLNQDPYLFNVANGTIDLRTATLQPHIFTDYMTVKSPVPYLPDADQTRWRASLEDMFQGDHELINLLRQSFAWTLTGEGSTVVQSFILLVGGTGTGKSYTQRVLWGMLGGRSCTEVPFAAFGKDSGGNTPYLAKTFGMRGVFVDDASGTAEWDGETLKIATGGSRMTTAAKYKAPISFTPTFSLWISVNDLPKIFGAGNKSAIFRRMRYIPFNRKFTEDPDMIASGVASKKDQALEDWLKDPDGGAPSVLAWSVEAMAEYLATRELPIPPASMEAMEIYKEVASGSFDLFAEECLEWSPDPGPLIARDFTLTNGDLAAAYVRWLTDQGYSKNMPTKKGTTSALRAFMLANTVKARVFTDRFSHAISASGVRAHGFRGVRLNQDGRLLALRVY